MIVACCYTQSSMVGLCVCVFVCLFLCRLCSWALQTQLNRSRCHLGEGAASSGPKVSCIKWGYDSGKYGWREEVTWGKPDASGRGANYSSMIAAVISGHVAEWLMSDIDLYYSVSRLDESICRCKGWQHGDAPSCQNSFITCRGSFYACCFVS